MITDTYTDWVLVSLSPLPASWKWLLFAAIAAATALVVRNYISSQRRWQLGALRIACALVLLGVILEPAVQTRLVRQVKDRLAIIVDRSESMNLSQNNGDKRYQTVVAALDGARDELQALGERHIVELFDLEGAVTDASLRQTPAGTTTDLMAAIDHVYQESGGRPLAGIMLISEGADNQGLELDSQGQLPAQTRRRLEQMGVPINTAWVTNLADFRDIGLKRVQSDEFAFVHNTMTIEVEIQSSGFRDLTVPVSLKRGDELLSTQQALVPSQESTTITFKTKPDAIGEFVYTVSIPEFSGEAILDNNERSFVVKVIRDKIRVLQVAGRPSWDERFLRQHLKENPNVDLISFFILRTPNDDPQVTEKELSLIPFPTDKIFDTELHTFDVVIFQNFDYRPYRMARYLPNIRDAVKDGLGFVMLGGPQSFAGGGYRGTAIEEILPIQLDQPTKTNSRAKFVLSPVGQVHPVTQLSRTKLTELWQGLPEWTSINITGALTPGASALVSARSDDGQLNDMPLISVSEVGKGRTMAISSDSMWRWRFADNQDGGASERAYHRFWSNSLRWLVRDPEHARVQVLPTRYRFETDAKAAATVRVLNQKYQPAANRPVRVTLFRSGSTVQVKDVTTGPNGTSRVEWDRLKPGAYRVQAKTQLASGEAAEGQGVFVIESQTLERMASAPNPPLLKAIAEATGGKAQPLSSGFFDSPNVVAPEVIEVDRRRNTELWDNGWALALMLGLFAGDWALRRRAGYL